MRDYRLYLDDILESCRKIQHYTAGILFDEFVSDLKTQDAVIRNFEIIGEAAKRLPDDIKSKFDGIEWAKLMGFRNVLIHDYFGVKLETVWNAIQEKIPNLETQTQKVLDEYTHVLVREDGN